MIQASCQLGNGLGVNRAISAKLEISATIERCLHRRWRTWRQRTSGVSNPRSVPIVTHVESATQHIIFCPFYTFRCPGAAASVAGTTRVTSADILHLFLIVSKELDKMPILPCQRDYSLPHSIAKGAAEDSDRRIGIFIDQARDTGAFQSTSSL